jgi:hypothetical protein
LLDLPLFGKNQGAAVIKARQMRSGDRDPDVADLNVRLVLGIENRFTDALGDGLHVDDLSLAHATRRGLSHSKNTDLIVSPGLGNDDADLRCSDLESHKDLLVGHGGRMDCRSLAD